MFGTKLGLLLSFGASVLYVSTLVYISVAPNPPANVPSSEVREPDIAPPPQPDTVPSSSTPQTQQPACRQEWRACADTRDLAENYHGWSAIKRACQTAVNNQTRFGQPLWAATPFSAFAHGTDFRRTGFVTIIDGNVKLQDGHGYYVRLEVVCSVDLKTGEVEDIYAR